MSKLLGSYRFLESSAPRVIERARADDFDAPIPSLPAVEFVKRATERGTADEETLRTIQRVAFDEGAEAPVLTRKFGELAFPQTDRERKEKMRGQIAAAARRLSALIAEPGAPVPKQLAVRVEEVVGGSWSRWRTEGPVECAALACACRAGSQRPPRLGGVDRLLSGEPRS